MRPRYLAVACVLAACSAEQTTANRGDAGPSGGGASGDGAEASGGKAAGSAGASGVGAKGTGGTGGGVSGNGARMNGGSSGNGARTDGGDDSSVSQPGSGGVTTKPPVGDAGTCDHLPSPGTWENVTPKGSAPKGVNGTVGAAVIVDPFDPRTVWLGTGSENQDIWRSDDCGATWTRVNTGPGSFGDRKSYGGVGDGAQWSMQVDPAEQGVLYAVSGYGAQSLWKSVDYGYSWTDLLSETEYGTHADYRFVNNVSMDPTDHLHVVVSTHGGCSAPYEPSCLAETKDGGKTWRVLRAPEGWFEGGGIVVVKGGQWLWCGSTLIMTKDGGVSWDKGQLAGGGSCEAEYTIRSFVPASNGKYYLGSRNGVLRSSDGFAWEHVPNTSGFMVMIAQGGKRVFAANQWSPSLSYVSLPDDEKWTELPAPPQISQGTDNGIPFLAYDDAHHIVYASMFSGGVARMVVP